VIALGYPTETYKRHAGRRTPVIRVASRRNIVMFMVRRATKVNCRFALGYVERFLLKVRAFLSWMKWIAYQCMMLLLLHR